MRGTAGIGREKAIATGAVVLALLLGAPFAAAAELSREEYVARVEPICKANVLANKRIFKGAKAQVRAGKLKAASRHFKRAATAFEATLRQIGAVPQPTADEARLAKWLGYLHTERDYVARIGKALAAGNRHKAESVSVLLKNNATRANNTVLGFGFNYCRIEPSRFG
jgi:hypothetical protein